MTLYRTIVADPPWPYKDAGNSSSTTLTRTEKVAGGIAEGSGNELCVHDYGRSRRARFGWDYPIGNQALGGEDVAA